MEIHKPKPVHSWRELLTEIGVVVIGVCIALAAEQAVEYFHWRGQVAEAREVIATELASDLVGAVIRIRSYPCTERRLDELALILDNAAKTGSLPPLGDIGIPPRRTWRSGAWDSVVASQTATHFSPGLLAALSDAYRNIDAIENYSPREVEAWNTLYTMAGPGRRFDPASEAALRQALSSARSYDNIVGGLADISVQEIVKLPLTLDRADRDRIAAAQNQPIDQTGGGGMCNPMGAVLSSYGHGFVYRPSSLAKSDETMKSLRDFTNGKP